MRAILARCAVVLLVVQIVAALGIGVALIAQYIVPFNEKQTLGYAAGAGVIVSLMVTAILWRDNSPGYADRRLYAVATDIFFLLVVMIGLLLEGYGIDRYGAIAVPVLWAVGYWVGQLSNTVGGMYVVSQVCLVVGFAIALVLLPIYALFALQETDQLYYYAGLVVSALYGLPAWMRFDREILRPYS
jgi:hypothetical protein